MDATHVAAHTGHMWNEHADKLAKRGRIGNRCVRQIHEQRTNPRLMTSRMAVDRTEVDRIIAATHEFGILGLGVRPEKYPAAVIESAYEKAREQMAQIPDSEEKRTAQKRLKEAYEKLHDEENQIRIGIRILGSKDEMMPIIHTVRCKVDMIALRKLLSSELGRARARDKH